MMKEQRLEYMRKRFPQLEENLTDAVIPMSKRDVQETVGEMDSFREFVRDKRTNKQALTSDEG
jgi:hypothetical protein